MTSEPAAPRSPRSPGSRVRAGARALLVIAGFVAIAELGALVLSEYVGTAVFSWLLPGLLGAGSGELASTVSYPVGRARPRPVLQVVIVVLGIAAPVVAALQAFRIADVPYGPVGRWLPPVLAAVAGALLLWLLPTSSLRPAGRRANPRNRPADEMTGSGADDDL